MLGMSFLLVLDTPLAATHDERSPSRLQLDRRQIFSFACTSSCSKRLGRWVDVCWVVGAHKIVK